MKKFSIIILVKDSYNLERCLNSIKENKYKNSELILIDKTNNNKINDVLKKFDSDNITYIKNEEFDFRNDFNKLIKGLTSDYFIMLDDADALGINALQILNEKVNKETVIKVNNSHTYKRDSGKNILPSLLNDSEYLNINIYLFKTDYIKTKKHFFTPLYLITTSLLDSLDTLVLNDSLIYNDSVKLNNKYLIEDYFLVIDRIKKDRLKEKREVINKISYLVLDYLPKAKYKNEKKEIRNNIKAEGFKEKLKKFKYRFK